MVQLPRGPATGEPASRGGDAGGSRASTSRPDRAEPSGWARLGSAVATPPRRVAPTPSRSARFAAPRPRACGGSGLPTGAARRSPRRGRPGGGARRGVDPASTRGSGSRTSRSSGRDRPTTGAPSPSAWRERGARSSARAVRHEEGRRPPRSAASRGACRARAAPAPVLRRPPSRGAASGAVRRAHRRIGRGRGRPRRPSRRGPRGRDRRRRSGTRGGRCARPSATRAADRRRLASDRSDLDLSAFAGHVR